MRSGAVWPPPEGTARDATSRCRAGVSAYGHVDANNDRFTALLYELSGETQFVLIRHSKRTMEAAQALYGVTQEEPGVSKLVRVRFD